MIHVKHLDCFGIDQPHLFHVKHGLESKLGAVNRFAKDM